VDRKTFLDVLSPEGEVALQAAAAIEHREVDFLLHFQVLSRRFPPDLAKAALEITIQRVKGREKFPFAERLYFTREALEQASSYEVSTYQAERYRPFPLVADLGCSAGGDSLALAEVASVIGIDRDPLRLAMAQANLRALNLDERASFIRADLTEQLPFSHILGNGGYRNTLAGTGSPCGVALFFDPARRAGERRAFSVHHYQPPLSIIKDWLPSFPALGVKISPGVDLKELKDYDAEVEFISLTGELKEAVLWFGPLKTAHRRATLLPGPHTLIPGGDSRLSISNPLAYLYEPDPAILRAGLVRDLGALLNMAQIDADIAYLTSDRLVETPFARAWAVEEWFPFGLKRLRAYLHQRGVGQVVVKKRGSPLQPEALIHDLRLRGDQERVVFLTHVQGQPVVIIGCELGEKDGQS